MKRIIVAAMAALLSISAAVANTLADGEVKKIDKAAAKLTIKHGPLQNLDMGAMTMVFKVQDPAMLEQVKVGGKIRFLAERVNGSIVVTKIENVE